MIICQQTRGALSSGDQLSLDLSLAADKSFSINPNNAAGFLLNSRVGPPASFSRASGATEIDSNGIIVFARENLAWWSESLTTSTTWTQSAITVVSAGMVGPNNVEAFEIAETSATAQHFIINRGGSAVNSTPIQTNTRYTASIYLKKASGGVDWVQLTLGTNGFASTIYVNVNVSNGTFGSSSGLAVTPQITSFPDGWYRVSFTVNSILAATSSNNITVAFTNNTDTTTRLPSYAGNTNNKILATMAQFECGSTVRDYILTTSSARYAPRFGHNSVTLASRGLLIEESRTNSILQSGIMGTAPWALQNATATLNAGTAPDGTNTASKLAETTLPNAQYLIWQSSTFSTGTYTLSVFIKAVERVAAYFEVGTAYVYVNLSTGAITSSGNFGSGWTFVSSSSQSFGGGWWRFTLTATCTIAGTYNMCKLHPAIGTQIVYAGTNGNGILIWGAQLEAGVNATSYIPTTSAAAARSADIPNFTGSAFSEFYNQTEGTLYVEYDRSSNQGAGSKFTWMVAAIYNPTSSTTWNTILSTSTSDGRVTYRNAGVDVYNNTPSLLAANTKIKASFAYKSGDFANTRNGTLAGTGSGTIPVTSNFDRLDLGFSNNGNFGPISVQYLNGHIAAVRFYRRRLPNAKPQALTV